MINLLNDVQPSLRNGARGAQPDAGGVIDTGELAVFAASEQAIDFVARGNTSFVLSSAVQHPHALFMGHYSVNNVQAALDQGEAGMRRIGLRKN